SASAISPLSLHDALPICGQPLRMWDRAAGRPVAPDAVHLCDRAVRQRRAAAASARRRTSLSGTAENTVAAAVPVLFAEAPDRLRSEEHTSELQSLAYLVC